MNSKIPLVLYKYIDFIYLYDSKLTKSDEDLLIHKKNLVLINNLKNLSNEIGYYSFNKNEISLDFIANNNINCLKFFQNKIKHSLYMSALRLKKDSFNIVDNNHIFCLLCIFEFSKITKDYLSIDDIKKTIDLIKENSINVINTSDKITINLDTELDDI